MIPARPSWLAWLALAACRTQIVRTDDGWAFDHPPDADILEPVDGDRYAVDEVVVLSGAASDDGPLAELDARWQIDGIDIPAEIDEEGLVTTPVTFADGGLHVIVLIVEDAAQSDDVDAVGIDVTAIP